MAEIDGERGHGYFYPTKDSAELTKPVDCTNLPLSCEDESCQGKANAMSHNSREDKESITLIWTPPSQFKGDVCITRNYLHFHYMLLTNKYLHRFPLLPQ